MLKVPSKQSPSIYEGFKIELDGNMREAHMTSSELFEILN